MRGIKIGEHQKVLKTSDFARKSSSSYGNWWVMALVRDDRLNYEFQTSFSFWKKKEADAFIKTFQGAEVEL